MMYLKLYLNNNRNILNIIKFSLISVFLLIFSFLIDRSRLISGEWLAPLMLTKEISTTFLSSLAGVFLTVTTFSFTTILTVLNQYASEYTPRVEQDFVDQPSVLSLFGIFIGGFFYSIFSLLLIQNAPENAKVISGTIGILYAMASMIYFMLFVKTVLKSVKTSDVIETIYKKANTLIEDEINDEGIKIDKVDLTGEGTLLFAPQSGYLYSINHQEMFTQLPPKCSLLIERQVGDYLYRGEPIGILYGPAEELETLKEQITEGYIFSATINDLDDYRHEIRNLIEIALKAISPGINDPNSAIIAIRCIAELIGKLLKHHQYYLIYTKEDHGQIVHHWPSVEETLYFVFYQLIHYGKTDPSLSITLIKALQYIYVNSHSLHQAEVKMFYDETFYFLHQQLEQSMDQDYLTKVYENLESYQKQTYKENL